MLEVNKIYNEDCIGDRGMCLIPDKSIDMILCDLPYGVTARNKWDIIIPFEPLWQQYERIIKDNGAMIFTASQPFTTELIISNKKLFKYTLVWNKNQVTGFLNAKKQPLRCHEDIVVFYKKQPTYNPEMTKGKRVLKNTGGDSTNYGKFTYQPHYSEMYYPKSIINIPQVRVKDGHPTQKPVTLFEYLIKTYTDEGDIVLDNCIGSGTTAVACININRKYIGYELDENYYNMAVEHISQRQKEVDFYNNYSIIGESR